MSQLQRTERVVEAFQARQKAPVIAVVLEGLDSRPEWAEPLDEGRVVRIIGSSVSDQRRLLDRWRKAPETPPAGVIHLPARPGGASFIAQAVAGPKREIACFGARGDRKTSAGALATLVHADLHQAAGFPLPTRWIVVSDTFASHKSKLIKTLQAVWWNGMWSFKDDLHTAVATIGGREYVHLELLGIEDQGALDRVRLEAHGVWFEEPAPAAVMETSAGVSVDAWGMALTSQGASRLPSHHFPAIITTNYPDSDHWTWVRFVVQKHPGTTYVRIPPGESASGEDRQKWAEALEGRPDLMRRLLQGEPGVISAGPQVALGYRSDVHVSRTRLRPTENAPLLIGLDGGLTPSATIAQYLGGGAALNVLAALACERGGTRQLCEDYIRPWLASNAGWALHQPRALQHYVDPSLDVPDQSNLEANPVRVIQAVLGGTVHLGPVEWPARRDPLLALLGKVNPMTGRPALQLDPEDALLLDRALSGRWHYPLVRGQVSREGPVKNHPWSDVADSATYIIAGAMPSRASRRNGRRDPPKHARSSVDWSPYDYTSWGRRRA